MFDFEAPDFAGGELFAGLGATLLVETVRRHVAAHRAVRRHFGLAEQSPQIVLPTRRPCVRVRVAADACSSSKFSRAVVPPDTAQRRQSGTCGSTPHDLCPPATSSKNLSPVSLVLDRPR